MPDVGRVAQQFLALPGQRRNRKDDDGGGDSDQHEHQQDHADKARNAIFVQPDHDGVQDHCDKEHQREQQDHRLQRPQDHPDDDQQENQRDDAPRAVITQRRMLILVLGFLHGIISYRRQRREQRFK